MIELSVDFDQRDVALVDGDAPISPLWFSQFNFANKLPQLGGHRSTGVIPAVSKL
ncbi:MAG: hypothetical protein ABI414_12535 [Devosia sp.]